MTELTADIVVAEIGAVDEYSRHAVTLEAAPSAETRALVTGSLIYRTYETDYTWLFSCGALEDATVGD